MEAVTVIIKVCIILFMYFAVGPGFGFMSQQKDTMRRIALGFIAWWIVRPPSDFTLMLYSIEFYRGHTKGFEFNYIEAICIGLALGALLEKRSDFKYLPPALWAWVFWVIASGLSVVKAVEPLYALMPAFKFIKMSFVFLGVFAAIHDERDVIALFRGFAIALILQILVCLNFRYIQGAYRVTGWFEHQNPMSMWSYMVALPMLGLAMAKQTSKGDLLLFFAAFGSAGLVVLLTVSRASLAALAIGTIFIMGASLLQGFTIRRISVMILMAVGGLGAGAMAADTFLERMETAGDDEPENDLRFALNQQSLAMLNDSPVVGIGWNCYGIMNSRPRGEKYSKVMEDWEAARGRTIYPHMFMANPLTESFYWLTLAETGRLGFFSWFLFIGLTLIYGLRCTIRYWKTKLGLFLFGIFVAFSITYIHCKVERVLTQTKNLTGWIMVCATLSRVEYWRRKKIKIDDWKKKPAS